MDATTLILADSIEKFPARQIGIGQFVLGDVKCARVASGLPPNRKWESTSDYNLKLDPATNKSNVDAHISNHPPAKGDQVILDLHQGSDEFQTIRPDQLTIRTQTTSASGRFRGSGKYKLEITINDKVGIKR